MESLWYISITKLSKRTVKCYLKQEYYHDCWQCEWYEHVSTLVVCKDHACNMGGHFLLCCALETVANICRFTVCEGHKMTQKHPGNLRRLILPHLQTDFFLSCWCLNSICYLKALDPWQKCIECKIVWHFVTWKVSAGSRKD